MDPQRYFEKHAFFNPLTKDVPSRNLGLIIVIPSYHEKGLWKVLDSLKHLVKPTVEVEILVVLNHGETDCQEIKAFHDEQFKQLIICQRAGFPDWLHLIPLEPVTFPSKIAGVGMARKVGMDEAVARFARIGKDGIIVNLDADCMVHRDYLVQIDTAFQQDLFTEAWSIGFVHHTIGCSPEEVEAMQAYELHLRLYINWQKHFGYPFAHQTLGSCFAVRSTAYCAQGGMNRRQAGEDFYFLHKFSAIGKLRSLQRPLVFPAARTSDRVPFGTGRAIGQHVRSNGCNSTMTTYAPQAIAVFCTNMFRLSNAYSDLKEHRQDWRSMVDSIELKEFLVQRSFDAELNKMLKHSGHAKTYSDRLHRYFDPFLLMKFLHTFQDTRWPRISVIDSFNEFVSKRNESNGPQSTISIEQALECMRKWDYPACYPMEFS